MKRTTLVLEDEIFREVRTRAARAGRSLKDCVNDLIRMGLKAEKKFDPDKLPRLPTFKMGMMNFNPSNREDLYPIEDDEIRMGLKRSKD